MSSFNALLQALLGGQYQGVGAQPGGNAVTVGPGQYYYNPTPNTLGPSNYMPTGGMLDTQGVTNPWAQQYGMPQEYNPTGSYRQNPDGTYTPSWAVAQNWMPEAWGGQLPQPGGTWQDYLNQLMGGGLFGDLAPTAGMAPYQPPQTPTVPSTGRTGTGTATSTNASQRYAPGGLSDWFSPAVMTYRGDPSKTNPYQYQGGVTGSGPQGWSNVQTGTVDPNAPRRFENLFPDKLGFAPGLQQPPDPNDDPWAWWEWWDRFRTDPGGGGGGGGRGDVHPPVNPNPPQEPPFTLGLGRGGWETPNAGASVGSVPRPGGQGAETWNPENPQVGEWDPNTGSWTFRTQGWGRYPQEQATSGMNRGVNQPAVTSTSGSTRGVPEWTGGVEVTSPYYRVNQGEFTGGPPNPQTPPGTTPPTTPPVTPGNRGKSVPRPGGQGGTIPVPIPIPGGSGGGVNVTQAQPWDKIWPYLQSLLGITENAAGAQPFDEQRSWAMGAMTDLPARYQSEQVTGPSWQTLMAQPGMQSMNQWLGGGGIPQFLGQYQGGIESAIQNMLGGEYMNNPALNAAMSNYSDLLTGAIKPHGQDQILGASQNALNASQGLIPQIQAALGNYMGGDFSKMALSPEVQQLASSLMQTGLPTGYDEMFKKRFYDPQRERLLGDLASRGVLDSGQRLQDERQMFQREYMDSLLAQQQAAQQAGAGLAMQNLLAGGQLGLQGVNQALGAQGQFAGQGMGGYNQVNQLLNQILQGGSQLGTNVGQLGLAGQQAGVGATTSALTQPYLQSLGLGLQQSGQGASMANQTAQQALASLLGESGVLQNVFGNAQGVHQSNVQNLINSIGAGSDWQRGLQGYDVALKGLGLDQAKLEELKKSGTLQLLASMFQGAPGWINALGKIFGWG